jgi:hypothetical protein
MRVIVVIVVVLLLFMLAFITYASWGDGGNNESEQTEEVSTGDSQYVHEPKEQEGTSPEEAEGYKETTLIDTGGPKQ